MVLGVRGIRGGFILYQKTEVFCESFSLAFCHAAILLVLELRRVKR